MEFKGNSDQPWVDWVKGRERQLVFFTSIARKRIDEGRSLSGQITAGKHRNSYVQQLDADLSVPRFSKNELWRTNALSYCQQEQLSRDSGRERPQLRRLPLLKHELNKCSQLLSHLKAGGAAVQKVTANSVATTASGSPPFVSYSTTFCRSCHSMPACTETRYAIAESSQPRVQEYAAGGLESGHRRFHCEPVEFDLQTQGTRLRETHDAESVRALKSDYRSDPGLTLSKDRLADATVVCHSEEVLPDRSTENDRPIITWLKGAKERTLVMRKSKSDVVRPRKVDHCHLSFKDFASSSRNCAACDPRVIPQQFHTPEPVHSRVRKHIDWHLPPRDHLPLRKREKTRSGLSCQLLGGASETERQGRPSGGRCRKSEACLGDLRLDVRRKSSPERRHHTRTKKQPKPIVVSLEQLLMDLINDEEEVGQLLATESKTFEVRSNKRSPKPSDECRAEEGLVDADRWTERKDDPTSQADSCSDYYWADIGTFTKAEQRSPHDSLRGETNDPYEVPDKCSFESYDLDEDDEKVNQRVVEMQRLADKVLNALLMDVAVELSSICSSVVDNLISAEFGNLGE